MSTNVDMSQFIAARSDQLNADDLMSGPRTITITKVTAQPDAAEQPVSIHYAGGEGRPWKPCKTMRRILVGVWGKDASKYVDRSLTLYRDPTVAFGGIQVGGIRISHMSDINEDKTVALLVTRGRKAPFKIKPLADAPQRSQPSDFSGQLAELKAVAKPGNMDALGVKWQEIGPEARKALAAELPALKAACEAPTPAAEDVSFDGGGSETTPADESVAKTIAAAEAAADEAALDKIIADTEPHKYALTDDQVMKLEIAFNNARTRLANAQGAETLV